jgi:hypothetical protein
MPHKEYNALGYSKEANEKRKELGWYSEYGPHPRYEMKEVKITIE